MKKKYQYFILFLIFTALTFLYSFYITKVNGDEIWNYGFAYNIYHGLVPYKDFNLITTPLFSFSTTLAFFLTNDSLLTFHLFSAIITALIITIASKKIGKKSLLLYPFLILGYLPTYNLFCLLLLTILLEISTNKNKKRDIYLGFIVSLIFLTKQTIGLSLLIPLFYDSNQKRKTILAFLLPILVLIVYLITNQALFQWLDYCFLGMSNFKESNQSYTFYSIITILLSIYLLYQFALSQKANYLYALMFQTMTLPIADKHHFFIALSIIIYVILIEKKLPQSFYHCAFLILYITLTTFIVINIQNVNFTSSNNSVQNFYSGRNLTDQQINYLENYKRALDYLENQNYDKLYVLTTNSYFLKLSQHQTITKFDLINNGNMGYHKEQGYIQEIEQTCQKEKCIFLTEVYENQNALGQTNQELLDYPSKHYQQKYRIGQFSIYE